MSKIKFSGLGSDPSLHSLLSALVGNIEVTIETESRVEETTLPRFAGLDRLVPGHWVIMHKSGEHESPVRSRDYPLEYSTREAAIQAIGPSPYTNNEAWSPLFIPAK